MNAIDEFLTELGASAYGWPESLRFTYDKTRELLEQGVAGDLVECGVANGVHPAAMARAAADAGEPRTVRLFDSFQGLPHAGLRDNDFIEAGYGDGSGKLEPIGVSVATVEDVQANLVRWGVDELGVPIVMHPGWFQDTLPAAAKMYREADVGIAFLRLDGDLYESTKVCLEHLYPLVSTGGLIVVDDWNLDGCRKAVREYWDAEQLPSIDAKPITSSGDIWWTKP